jgi:hypothetical protein
LAPKHNSEIINLLNSGFIAVVILNLLKFTTMFSEEKFVIFLKISSKFLSIGLFGIHVLTFTKPKQ